jgi:hypothetical protein
MAGLQHALQARDHHRPAAGDVAQGLAALVEIVVGHGQLDDFAARLQIEGDARSALAFGVFRARIPGVGEAARRIGFQHLALDARLALPGEAIG